MELIIIEVRKNFKFSNLIINMRTNKISIIFFIAVLSFSNLACGQQISKTVSAENVRVEKRECEYKGVKGFKLILHYKNGDVEKMSKVNNYGLTEFVGLSDAVKLQFVEKLLEYQNDSSIVCIPVNNYGYAGYENTCNDKPISKTYTIQLDALYLINKICYPNAASFYYCFPALVDVNSGKEINTNAKDLSGVFPLYKNWFAEARGSIGGDFPFNKGKYCWFGGRKSE